MTVGNSARALCWGSAFAIAAAGSLLALPAGAARAATVHPAASPTAAAAAVHQAAQSPSGIVRIAGADRIDTAVRTSAAFWVRSGDAVLASASDFPDALAAAALAAALDAPLLLTPPDSLPAAVAQELDRLSAARITVAGGPKAIHDKVLDQLRALPTAPAVRRLSGATRYETAAAIARRIGPADRVVIASGVTFADALAAGNLAGSSPIVLTAPDALTPAAADALAALAPSEVVIVGGRAAVAAQVEAELRQHAPTVRRLAGAHRFETAAVAAAFRLSMDPPVQRAVVATGEQFPDGLAAGALAAHLDAIVVLSPQRRITDETDALLREHADGLIGAVLKGGSAALGNHVEAEISAALNGEPRPGFEGSVGPLPQDVRDEMTGVSWRAGCPIGLDELTLIELLHWDFEGQVREGRLVVANRVAEDILGVFASLFDAGFPLHRVRLVDDYDGDDDRSMAANNTHAFNCRYVAGTSRWSEHAFGTAIDINPVQNPYVAAGSAQPPAGAEYLNRADVRPGMIVRPGSVLDAFSEIGWGWGGDWSSTKDYQHFSESGR
ncbi:MAG TPA: cell wall-binding repeat-containing protein [Egibacteraceae bacterium]|nr:cell wall-binding repeat-containing protein [Egibacteraceae bacterium]